jgi:hypothetical protein
MEVLLINPKRRDVLGGWCEKLSVTAFTGFVVGAFGAQVSLLSGWQLAMLGYFALVLLAAAMGFRD